MAQEDVKKHVDGLLKQFSSGIEILYTLPIDKYPENERTALRILKKLGVVRDSIVPEENVITYKATKRYLDLVREDRVDALSPLIVGEIKKYISFQ